MVDNLLYPQDDRQFHAVLYNSSREPSPHSVPMIRTVIIRYVEWCEHVLGSVRLMDILRHERFDLAIIDGHLKNRCLYTIPYKLNLTYITLTETPDPWNLRVGSFPSVEPMGTIPFSDKMPFLYRFYNLVMLLKRACFLPKLVADDYLVNKYVPEKPSKSLMELYKDSKMFLVNAETLILDYPRVSAPHYQFVGGSGCKLSSQNLMELNDFYTDGHDGIIVVSFGSYSKHMPLTILEEMLNAFGKLPMLRFVMDFNGNTPSHVPNNVKLIKDLPLNGVLGLGGVRALITHGDERHQIDALCHAVPQIVIPLYGEQRYNAERTRARKYGVTMEITDLKADDLVSNIKEVIANKQYLINSQKASKLARSLPDANERIVFWVEHILQFGWEHLRPSFLDMPLHEFLMLDIIVVILISIHLFAFIAYKLIVKFCLIFKRIAKEKLLWLIHTNQNSH